MKRFQELNTREALNYILASKTLSNRFDEYIYNTEMDYIGDKLSCFSRSGADWCISTCEPSYFRVRNARECLDGIQKSISSYGATEKLTRLANTCAKLEGSNLFEHFVKRVASLYYKQEIESLTEWIAHCGHLIYCQEAHEDLVDYVECFLYCQCDNVFINENNELIEIVQL